MVYSDGSVLYHPVCMAGGVATVLALVPLPLMRYEHETRRNEKIRAVAFALIVVLCNICVLILTHHHV